MSTNPMDVVGAGIATLDDPAFSTNVGQSLSAAGSSFGDLIKGVGNAVAATQKKLTETSAATTSALAGTMIDVIAVQAKNYDDNGTLTASSTFVRNLPLIDFIDPVFYQWTQVRLQGQFTISEFAASNSKDVSTFHSVDHSGQHGLFIVLGGGQTGVAFNDSDTKTTSQSDQAQAVGRARMYAQLNPRSDVGVPKPNKVIQGPSLQVIQGEVKDLPAAGANPLTGRTMALMLQLRKIDGTPISGKAISVSTDGVPWNFTGASVTGADGNVEILLQRTFLPVPAGAPAGTVPDTAAAEVVVTVRIGLVSNSTTVML